MFAPKVATAGTKASAGPTNKQAPQRSTLAARSIGHGGEFEHLRMIQWSIGDQALLRLSAQGTSSLTGNELHRDPYQRAAPENKTALKTLRGPSWDFSKIPIFPPDRPSGRLHVPCAGATQTKPAIDKPGNGYEQKAEAPEERTSNLVPPPMAPGFHFNFAPVPVTVPPMQCKPLEIGEAGDPFEREADRVADGVMRTPAGDPPRVSRIGSFAGSQRAAPPTVEEVLEAAGEPLAPATRAFFEPKFGHDFKTIRLHANDRAAKSADAVHARAYAVGDDIVFGRNQYQPETGAGRRLLAHELAHTLQQSGRRRVMREPPTPPPQQRVAHPNVMQDIEGKFTLLYAKLSPKARYRLNRNITIAIGIVTEKSDKEANEPRFVYTLSGNASSKDIDAAADELGLTRWKPSARAPGRGAVGAPNDAEQLLTEGAETNHFDVWAVGVNRRFCPDCAVHMKEAEVPAQAFPDGAFRQGGALYKYQPPAGGGEEGGGEPAVVAPGGQGKQTTPPKTQGASGTPPTATKTTGGTGAQSEHEGGETKPVTGGAGQTQGMSRASQIGMHIGIGAASVGLSVLAAYLKGRVDAKIAQRQIDAFLHFAGEWINAHPDEALKKMMFAPEVTTYAWVFLKSSVITFFEASTSPEPITSDSSPMIDLAGIDYLYKPVDPAMPQNFFTGISGGGRHLTTTRMLVIDIPLVTPSVEDMFEYAKSRNIWLGGLRDYVMYRLKKSVANLEIAVANLQLHRGTQQDIDKATLQNRYWQNMADQILGAEKQQQVTPGH